LYMMEHDAKADNFWDRFSDTYDEKVETLFGKELRPKLARLLDREHDLGDAVEIGCGTGYFTAVLAKNARHVTATDISPNMLDAAKRRLHGVNNVTFQIENGEATSFSSDRFDMVLMANTLHAMDSPLKALQESYRILRKGGRVVIINYTDECMGNAEKIFLLFRFAIKFGFPPRRHWPVTSDRLSSLMIAAGFDVECIGLINGKINTLYARAKRNK